MTKVISIFDGVLEKFSKWGLVSSLFLILGLAVISIVLRWLGSSVMWLEPLTRHLVFLSAFFGGSLATSANVHIRVDVATKLVEMTKSKPLIWFVHNLVAVFCFVTCAFLMKVSYDFFMVEREFGAPSFLNIHSSWLVGIIPFGMGLIALRFLNVLLLGLLNGVKREHNSL